MSHSAALIKKLWNYCNILRDDGLSYGDYVEQFDPAVAGLFLKALGDERRNR
jgi:type I restriction enzyme M protein